MRLIMLSLLLLLSAAGPAGAEEAPGDRSWPVGNRPAVVRAWDPPTSAYGPGHRGVDLGAPAGAPVRAAAAGTVFFAGRVAGRGVVSITVAGTGLRTTYEPVEPLVEKGAEVTAGARVATLSPGSFHCAEPCLHWGLLDGDTYLDPLTLLPPELLRRPPPRLLPVFGVPETGTTPVLAATTTAPAHALLLAAVALWACGRLSPVRRREPSRPPRRRSRRGSPRPPRSVAPPRRPRPAGASPRGGAVPVPGPPAPPRSWR